MSTGDSILVLVSIALFVTLALVAMVWVTGRNRKDDDETR